MQSDTGRAHDRIRERERREDNIIVVIEGVLWRPQEQRETINCARGKNLTFQIMLLLLIIYFSKSRQIAAHVSPHPRLRCYKSQRWRCTTVYKSDKFAAIDQERQMVRTNKTKINISLFLLLPLLPLLLGRHSSTFFAALARRLYPLCVFFILRNY